MQVIYFRQLLTGQSRTKVGVLSFHQVQHVFARTHPDSCGYWTGRVSGRPNRDTLIAVTIIQSLDLADTEVQ